jgi:hypothetical protein
LCYITLPPYSPNLTTQTTYCEDDYDYYYDYEMLYSLNGTIMTHIADIPKQTKEYGKCLSGLQQV